MDAINQTDTINAVVALGPAGTGPAVAAIDELDRHCTAARAPDKTQDCIAVTTFDTSIPTMDFIEVSLLICCGPAGGGEWQF